MRLVRPVLLGSVVAVAMALAAPVAHAVPTYTLYYLNDTPATPDPNPTAPTTQPDRQVVGLNINNSGQTTGCVENSNSAFPPGFCVLSAPTGDATAYRSTLNVVTALPPLGTGLRSIGLAINNAGQVTGWSYIDSTDSEYHAFRDATDLTPAPVTIGFPNSLGNAINASGQVAGFLADASTSSFRAFRTDSGTTVTDLQTLTGGLGGNMSEAKAINAGGAVTGWATIDAGDTTAHAFRQSGIAAMDDLGTVAGKTHSFGVGINTAGTVIGCATDTAAGCTFSDSRAFIATGAVAVDLLPAVSTANSGANDVTSSDIVVGWVENGVTYANPNPCNQGVCDAVLAQTRAFWYDDSTTIMTMIPLLPADPDLTGLLFRQVAQAINDDDMVVGYQEMWVDHDADLGTAPILRRHGWLYDIDTGELVDIDADILALVPGLDPNWHDLWRFTNGFDIAESGAILTFCRFMNDSDPVYKDGTELRACVLVPTPEPASFASFAAGLAALAALTAFAAARRRRSVRA